MKISEIIEKLFEIKNKHGDLEVLCETGSEMFIAKSIKYGDVYDESTGKIIDKFVVIE